MSSLEEQYNKQFFNMLENTKEKLYDINKFKVLDNANKVLNSYDFQNKSFPDSGQNYGLIKLDEYLISEENIDYMEFDKTVYGVKVDSILANDINISLKDKYFKLLKEEGFFVNVDSDCYNMEVKIFFSKSPIIFEKFLEWACIITMIIAIVLFIKTFIL
ncbi:hypothetical protein I9Y33_001458 [Clostridium perfringens]|nr:hypothetical protein [Clostridium perfringens]EGT0013595.1 hypothetical protein [Clostridium perfringens]